VLLCTIDKLASVKTGPDFTRHHPGGSAEWIYDFVVFSGQLLRHVAVALLAALASAWMLLWPISSVSMSRSLVANVKSG